MAKKPLPTPELMRQLLTYAPETGKLFWKERPRELFVSKYEKMADAQHRRFNLTMAGEEAFTAVDGYGYFHACIMGHWMKAHRVAAAIITGRWPENEIDHINGDRRDNRACNLREATHGENQKNCQLSRRNSSGMTGVYWNKVHQCWVARIYVDGKTISLGTFQKIEDAITARRSAEVKYRFGPTHGQKRKVSDRYIKKQDRL